MVTTRSQLRSSASANPERTRRSSGSSSSGSASASPKGRKDVIVVDGESPPSKPRSSTVSRLMDMPGGADGVEHLGRGCRQHRPVITLDEEYLSQSMHKPNHPKRMGSGGQAGDATPDPFIIHHRYPERDAAKRALSSLSTTLREMKRSANTADSGSDESEGSDASASESDAQGRREGSFHFRHHPDALTSGHKRSGSSSFSSSSSSSSSSSEDGDKDEQTAQRSSGGARSSGNGGARTSATSMGSRVTNMRKASSGTVAAGQKRARSSGSVTDASISDDSVREESIEQLAQQDARLPHDEDGTDDGVSDEDDVVTQSEMRRATRNAKESVEKNININYYMQDAVGSHVPEKKQRKHELDRRYRHLFETTHSAESGGGVGEFGSGTGGGVGVGNAGESSAAGALGDISPLHIDDNIAFDSVGGLPEHIVTLREMVLLPLLYPDLLRQLNLSPPRGVLFVGPPGTGKTLMARALANEGSRFTGQKITFFMRKGADILSKWVGESERQLKLLFEEAKRQQPSIIFFDEIDGLAPTRHTKTEQTQAALVATLLALLDGMEDRGQVVVIGATNRPDTLDPALRRPGRFDRELLFPSPDAAARRHILGILTQTLLPASHPRRDDILSALVAHTEGYSGADLQAICTEAGLNRLRSAFPELYTSSKRLRLPASVSAALTAPAGTPTTGGPLEIRKEDFFIAVQRVQPSLRRGGAEMRSLASLEEHQEVLYRDLRDALLQRMATVWPTVARALRKAQRDCTNLVAAVRDLTSFPVPYPRGPLLLFLSCEPTTEAAVDTTLTTTKSPQKSPKGKRYPADLHARHSASNSSTSSKGGRASGSVTSAVKALNPSALLTGEAQATDTAVVQATLLHTALSVLKGLPSFQTLIVHLPHIQVSFNDLPFGASTGGVGGAGAGGSAALFSDVFASGHIYELVQVAQRSSPCAVILRGAGEWLHTHGLPCGTVRQTTNEESDSTEKPTTAPLPPRDVSDTCLTLDAETYDRRAGNMRALQYYLNLLAETEVLLVVPCEDPRTRDAILGTSPSALPQAMPLHPRFAVMNMAVPPQPETHAVEQFAVHLYHLVSLSLTVALRANASARPAEASSLASQPAGEPRKRGTGGGGGVEEEDEHVPALLLPMSKARQAAERQRELALWRRVEYRRLQLRHVLLKWVSQYVTNGKYKLLLSPDLDLTPSHDLYKAWQRHTKGRRIGLQDVIEKLEHEAYTCLSQYHDDIDLITRNVRSFFSSRSLQDQRYRLKALELKEATVLGLYRINRGVVRFCEVHKDVQEPAPSPRDGESEEASAARSSQKDPLTFSQRPAPAVRKKSRQTRYFGARRRRRRPAPEAVTTRAFPSPQSDHDDDEEHEEKEEAVSSEDEAPTSPFSPTQAPAETLIHWATTQLSGLRYHVLLDLFRCMMMSLEVQTQALQSTATNTLAGEQTTALPSMAANRATPMGPSRQPVALSAFTPLAPPPPLTTHPTPAVHVEAAMLTSPPARDPRGDSFQTPTKTSINDNSPQRSPHSHASSRSSHGGPQTVPDHRHARVTEDNATAAAAALTEDDVEQSEKAYITAFFQRSLLAALVDCQYV